jgi:uncharacterized protein YbjT (DUF2867 family)
MPNRPAILITGASGYIGGAIARGLIGTSEIRGLTFHPSKNRFGDRVHNFLYDFEHPQRMAAAFAGVDVFVNTYYVRFNYASATFERAVQQSRTLIDAAKSGGVRKIVHVSVSNADEASPLPYYRNKARIERLVRESGRDFTILRPAIVVGEGDILVNNIAFFLRRLPVFTIFGDGVYRVQPMMLDAFAEIAVEAVNGAHPQATLAVAGPNDWRFIDLVRAVRESVGSRAALVRGPAWFALAGLKVAGTLLGDVVLTADEIAGLTNEYLYAEEPLRRGSDVGAWLTTSSVRAELGRKYSSELARHFR